MLKVAVVCRGDLPIQPNRHRMDGLPGLKSGRPEPKSQESSVAVDLRRIPTSQSPEQAIDIALGIGSMETPVVASATLSGTAFGDFFPAVASPQRGAEKGPRWHRPPQCRRSLAPSLAAAGTAGGFLVCPLTPTSLRISLAGHACTGLKLCLNLLTSLTSSRSSGEKLWLRTAAVRLAR